MFVFLGEFSVSGNGLEAYLRKHGWGRMWARDPVKFEYPQEFCAFDNGAYSCWQKGEEFNEGKFLRRLTQLQEAIKPNPRRCLFGVVPDIPTLGLASLRYSMWWREQLMMDIPWYLCLQDGMDVRTVGHVQHKFDGLFLGGSDDFKRSAKYWCDFAHERGKPFHYGRCSTVNRVRDAIAIRADSIDSAIPVINWNMGEKKRATAKAWLNVADGKDQQQSFIPAEVLTDAQHGGQS